MPSFVRRRYSKFKKTEHLGKGVGSKFMFRIIYYIITKYLIGKKKS